jgi:hypothetical protein
MQLLKRVVIATDGRLELNLALIYRLRQQKTALHCSVMAILAVVVVLTVQLVDLKRCHNLNNLNIIYV